MIYWLGGSPCSGKSTVAEILAKRYNLHYYRCDDAFTRHQQASSTTNQPTLHQLGTLTSDEIWLAPVAEQLQREIAIYREEFAMILADLETLPADRPILAEGAALMPELVARDSQWRTHAAWIVPTPAFQQHHYAQRAWVADVLSTCSAPEQAYANWMARDEAFAHHVTTTAEEHNLPLLQVDGTKSIEANAAWVAGQLGLPSYS